MNKASSVQIKSTLSETSKFTQSLLKHLQDFCVDEAAVFDIKLALEEALINAVKHGSKNKSALSIEIDYSISDSSFKISIQDQGSGFNYKGLQDPTAGKNLLKTQGRGIYLIRHLMDEVSFNKSGNKITMIKYLTPPKNRAKGEACR